MTLVCTPSERFEGLPGYDYEAASVSVGEPEMASVDVGDPDAEETFLCLHGEPTWSYLYRKMIPLRKVHRPRRLHLRDALRESPAFVAELDLMDVTLVCRDWGGVRELPVATLAQPERFARLVPMNTGPPTGDDGMIDAWWAFREYMAETEDSPISTVVRALGGMAHCAALDEQSEPWLAPVEAGEVVAAEIVDFVQRTSPSVRR